MIEEIWKWIVGYEGQYKVSNFGKVKSLKFGKQKILKLLDNMKGYLYVSLFKDRKRFNKAVFVLKASSLFTVLVTCKR